MIVFFSSTAFISFFSELNSKLESFFWTDISTRLKLSASWWNYLTVGPQKCWPKNIEILKIANFTYLDLKEGWTLPIKCPQKIKTKEEWERYVKQCCSNLGDLVIAQEPRGRCDGLMVSGRSTPEQVVWVQALAGDIVFCSWTRQDMCLSPPRCINGYRRT